MSTTRRQLLGQGLGAAGVAALPASLSAAAPALAQESDETNALARIVELERAAELAYGLAVEDGDLDAEVREAFERFGGFCDQHATALAEAIDQLDVDPPEAESDPAGYERLSEFDANAPKREQLAFMIALEEDLAAIYADENRSLEEPDLVRSAAQIAASHAQALVVLRLLAGSQPAAALR